MSSEHVNGSGSQDVVVGWVYSLAVGGGCYLPVRVERDLGNGRYGGTVLRGGGLLGLPDGPLDGWTFDGRDLKNGQPEEQWRRQQERRNHGCPELRDMIRQCVSPEAVAVMASALLGARPTGDGTVDSGVRWFAEQLAECLGGWDRVNNVLAELGCITIDRR